MFIGEKINSYSRYLALLLFRDLAARNCLIDETDFILKLADFGLTKVLEGDEEILPVRWAAVELMSKSIYFS